MTFCLLFFGCNISVIYVCLTAASLKQLCLLIYQLLFVVMHVHRKSNQIVKIKKMNKWLNGIM